MDRKEFLNKLGLGAAFVLTVPCFHSCTSDSINPEDPKNTIDFTIDLDNTAYEALSRNGGFVVERKIVIARTINGDYAAATLKCSHQSWEKIIYDDRQDIWFCTQHAAQFDLDGNGLNANGRNGLTIYNVEQQGNMLRIFSS